MVGVSGSRPLSSIGGKTALEKGFGKVLRLCWILFRLLGALNRRGTRRARIRCLIDNERVVRGV
jgi:hypothetical protein